jgi:hypothetical protein
LASKNPLRAGSGTKIRWTPPGFRTIVPPTESSGFMAVDKHTLQGWVAGAEFRVKKSRRPLGGVPVLNQVKSLADATQSYTYKEKIDLTRARNFRMQEGSEDFLFASVSLPIMGKRSLGNDTGMAVASFDYTDREGDQHNVIAICAYVISGVIKKERVLKQVLTIRVV